MKKVFVVVALMAAVGAQAAPQKTTRAASANRGKSTRSVVAVQPQAKKSAAPKAATTEESGSCFSCYWNAGLFTPLTFEEDLKFDMCKAKYCWN